MPFSFHPILNLPIITEEEESAELDALSEQERLQIHLDVYGRPLEAGHPDGVNATAQDSKVSPDTLNRELKNLRVAIDALPESEKREYREAQDLVPQLVQVESPPEAFLRREDLNAEAAAARLVSYWKQRKDLFGSERAFLPLDLREALRDDLELIDQALLLPLPSDRHGRPVLLWNRTGYDSSGRQFSTDAVHRVFMFIANKCAYATHKGFVLLNNMQGLALPNNRFDRSISKRFVTLMAALPFRILSIHICTGPGKSVGGLILPVLKYLYGREIRLRTSFHSGSFSEILQMLEDFGISEEQVTPLCGSSEDRKDLMQQWLAGHTRRDDDT